MIDKTTFVICGDTYRNKTIGSILFGKWGNPIRTDIRLIDKFVDAVNHNFDKLVNKYRKNTWAWQDLKDKEITCENKNILDCVKGYHMESINLSNIMDFKYNYINDNIDKWINLISPATKSFINSNTKQNPYNDPPCEKLELDVPVEKIHEEILKIKKWLVPHRE